MYGSRELKRFNEICGMLLELAEISTLYDDTSDYYVDNIVQLAEQIMKAAAGSSMDDLRTGLAEAKEKYDIIGRLADMRNSYDGDTYLVCFRVNNYPPYMGLKYKDGRPITDLDGGPCDEQWTDTWEDYLRKHPEVYDMIQEDALRMYTEEQILEGLADEDLSKIHCRFSLVGYNEEYLALVEWGSEKLTHRRCDFRDWDLDDLQALEQSIEVIKLSTDSFDDDLEFHAADHRRRLELEWEEQLDDFKSRLTA